MQKLLHIERLCYGADAIAHDEGKTVFVSGAAPGDDVLTEIVEERAGFNRAKTVEVRAAGPMRVEPVCSACGGCPWSCISYEAQIASKAENLADALERIARFGTCRVRGMVAPCVPSPKRWGYRNKIELSAFTDEKGLLNLGMAKDGADVPLSECPLAAEPLRKAPAALRGCLRRIAGSADLGIFRIGLRASEATGSLEVALWTRPGPFPRAQAAKMLKAALNATSVVRVIASPGKARSVKAVEALAGPGCWEERLDVALTPGEKRRPFRFKTSAPSFFQVNTAQAATLVEAAFAGLGDVAGMRVADLYAGGGTFGIPLAAAGAQVVAVESAASSVRDLRRNADLNNVAIEVRGGDAARELSQLGRLDALVVDPPRAGLAKGVVPDIAAAGPERVIYVSCDPATLARDLALFEHEGYYAEWARPVDLFPQTFHAETVALLTRIK